MQTVKGVVKALSKYGKGFCIEGVDGWFTAYKDSDVAGADVGTTVEFKYTTKPNPNGADYMNIKGQVNVVSAAAPSTGGGNRGGGGGGKAGSTGQQIMRQNALTNATALYASGTIDTASNPKDAITDVLKIANVFANYSAGNIEVKGWPGAASSEPAQQQRAEVPEPAQQEPTPEPEPEQVAPTSASLDDFMNG